MRPLYCRLFHHHDRAAERTIEQVEREHRIRTTEALTAWAQARDPFPATTRTPTGAPRGSAAERDRRGSRRTLLAAALIRRGDDLHQIATITGVPVALLELIRDELDTDDGVDDPLSAPPRPRRRRRSLILAVVLIETAAIANIVACITAVLHHLTAFGVLTGLVAVALIIAVWATARALTHTVTGPVIYPWLAPGTLNPNHPEPDHPDRDRETGTDS